LENEPAGTVRVRGKNFGKIPFYTRVTTVPRVSAFARDSSHCVSIAAAFIVSAERAGPIF